jgi:hypothetical protein
VPDTGGALTGTLEAPPRSSYYLQVCDTNATPGRAVTHLRGAGPLPQGVARQPDNAHILLIGRPIRRGPSPARCTVRWHLQGGRGSSESSRPQPETESGGTSPAANHMTGDRVWGGWTHSARTHTLFTDLTHFPQLVVLLACALSSDVAALGWHYCGRRHVCTRCSGALPTSGPVCGRAVEHNTQLHFSPADTPQNWLSAPMTLEDSRTTAMKNEFLVVGDERHYPMPSLLVESPWALC